MAQAEDMPMLKMWLLNTICAAIKAYEQNTGLVVRRVEIWRNARRGERPGSVFRVEAEISDKEA